MNIEYATSLQSLSGSKRKEPDLSNVGLLNTANSVNSAVRPKISNGNSTVSSNHNSNSAVVEKKVGPAEDYFFCQITGTTVRSLEKKVTHNFSGRKVELVAKIRNQIQEMGILDGDGQVSALNEGQVENTSTDLRFKVEGGFQSKFTGKLSKYLGIYDGPVSLVQNCLVSHGATKLTRPNGVVFNGKAVPALKEGVYKSIFLEGEGSYQGKIPPDKVVIFDTKIENGIATKAAYLPSGEKVVDLHEIGNDVLVGKKVNAPAAEGQIVDGKLQGKWVKFVRCDINAATAYDGLFENDDFVEGTVYTAEGVTAKVTKPSK